MASFLQVKNLTHIYSAGTPFEHKALDSVSFCVERGEFIGIIGHTGSGKSTLMKIITCFIPPTSGNVNVCGYNIFDNPLDIRRNIGYLPEHNPLYLEMYVREFLIFVAGIYGIKNNTKQRVEEIIELTGLTKEANKKIGQLSKGYRQRVGLAQAMIGDPELLILDEPTTGLDPNQLEDIRALIREMGEQRTIILSTHILQEVKQMCTRVVIINHGEIKVDKPICEIEDLEETFKQATKNE